MKNIIITNSILMIIFSIQLNAQVAIGKNSVSNNSVSLEFGSENRGIVLPYVQDKSKISEKGTLIFDTTDFKVKYLKGGGWFDLTVDTTGNADLSIQNNKEEQAEASVFIGPATSTNGILILQDHDRAMILPKVDSPHLNIINPSAGMMVYDTKVRQLAVYNGKVWTFWKP